MAVTITCIRVEAPNFRLARSTCQCTVASLMPRIWLIAQSDLPAANPMQAIALARGEIGRPFPKPPAEHGQGAVVQAHGQEAQLPEDAGTSVTCSPAKVTSAR